MRSAKRGPLLIFCVLVALSASIQPAAAMARSVKQEKRAIYCPTPTSIMLHSSDAVYGMQWLARTIETKGLQTMTYRQVSDLWKRGLCPPENAILISLDDLGTSWLRQEFKDMIRVFTTKGFVLTLGVVTGTMESSQKEEIWDYLRGLEVQGVEIASHSARHNLLEKIKEEDLKVESEDSYRMLCEQLRRCPVTFILPFGRGSENDRVMEVLKEEYTNIVSIQAPRVFGAVPLLFKRIPLVKEENNPREPKLGAPYFIQMQVKDRDFTPHTYPFRTEAQ
jgi:hypothetical protein